MKAPSILICFLGVFSLHASAADAHAASAILKLEKGTEVEAKETQAFLEKVKSRPALDEIAARLALTQAWKLDHEQTAVKLAGMLEISASGGDGKITAENESPQMAAIIANTAASVLRDRSDGANEKSMEKLNETVLEQEDSVRQKRSTLAQIIREQAVIIKDGEQPEPKTPDPLAAQGFIDAKKDFETAQKLLVELKAAKTEAAAKGGIRVHHVIWAKAPEE